MVAIACVVGFDAPGADAVGPDAMRIDAARAAGLPATYSRQGNMVDILNYLGQSIHPERCGLYHVPLTEHHIDICWISAYQSHMIKTVHGLSSMQMDRLQ